METFKKWANSPFVIAALFAIFGISDLLLTGFMFDLSKSDWAAWVAAIGTIGTLIGTIWIATGERRERQHRDRALARINAVAFEITIADTIKSLDGAVNYLKDFEACGRVGNLRDAQNCILEISPWAPESVVPIIGISPNLASELARATRVLSRIKSNSADEMTFKNQGISLALSMISSQRITCENIVQDLLICLEQCRSATKRN